MTKASFVGLEQLESMKLSPDRLLSSLPGLLGRYLSPDRFSSGNSSPAFTLFLEPCGSLLEPSAGPGPPERRHRCLSPQRRHMASPPPFLFCSTHPLPLSHGPLVFPVINLSAGTANIC